MTPPPPSAPDDRRLAAAFDRMVARPSDRSGCPDAEALLAVAEGRADTGERHRTLGHVATCRGCRDDLNLLRTVAVAGDRMARRPAVPWALAAAVMLAVVGGTLYTVLRPGPGDVVVRSATRRLVTVAPAGDVGRPIAFVWHPETTALSYQVTVVDSAGGVAWSERLADTTAAAPADGRIAASRDYRWWVEAYLRDGTSIRSEVRAFRTMP